MANNRTYDFMLTQLIGATENDLDGLEACRSNIQSLVDNGQRISQREATERMMAAAFIIGFNRGAK